MGSAACDEIPPRRAVENSHIIASRTKQYGKQLQEHGNRYVSMPLVVVHDETLHEKQKISKKKNSKYIDINVKFSRVSHHTRRKNKMKLN